MKLMFVCVLRKCMELMFVCVFRKCMEKRYTQRGFMDVSRTRSSYEFLKINFRSVWFVYVSEVVALCSQPTNIGK